MQYTVFLANGMSKIEVFVKFLIQAEHDMNEKF